MRIDYKKDEDGKDILTDSSGFHQVMMEWEKEYMEQCIKKLNPSGRVLEIGFGMGYSAQEIVNHDDVTEYTVIECSPQVWENFKNFEKKNSGRCKINLVRGRWQDVLHTCGQFDFCFFDDYDFNNNPKRFLDFAHSFFNNHCAVGSKVGLFSSTPSSFIMEGTTIEDEQFHVDIPEYCNYAKEVWMPIITKIHDKVEFPTPKKLNQNVSFLVQDNFKNFEDELEIFGKVFEVCPYGDWLFIQFMGVGTVVKICETIVIVDVKDRVVVTKNENVTISGNANVTKLKSKN